MCNESKDITKEILVKVKISSQNIFCNHLIPIRYVRTKILGNDSYKVGGKSTLPITE